MEKVPFLSVIMPMYNAEKYLRDTISSILDQTFEDFELIIVDDRSTDKSLEICREFVEKDSRVKTVTVEKNGGAGNARNIGMQMAKGKYITFMDSDDTIDNTLYYNAYKKTVEHDLDMVVWGVQEEYLDEHGNCYFQNRLNLPEKICTNVEQIKDMVILLEEKTIFGYQWNRFYRADILKKNKIRFEKVILYEDYFFNLEVIKKINSMGIIPDTGYHYMKRAGGSITSRFVPEYFELSKRRIKSMYQLYQHWNAENVQVKNILGERYLRYILAGLTKSFDKRAGSSFIHRRNWLYEVCNDKLYVQIVRNCMVNQKSMKIFQSILNRNMWTASIAFGRCVWIVREKMPLIFNRIRRFR